MQVIKNRELLIDQITRYMRQIWNLDGIIKNERTTLV